MGCRITKLLPAPPKVITKLTGDELRNILQTQLNNPDRMHITDAMYGLYSMNDLKGFLESDYTDSLKYVKESFDCDNFAMVLLGHEKEWYGQGKTFCGSCFGYLAGDIRKSETDTERRGHAVNFFIDENKKVWLIEPQTDAIFELTSNSKVWIAIV